MNLEDSKQVLVKALKSIMKPAKLKQLIASNGSIQETVLDLSGASLFTTEYEDVYEMTSRIN